MGHRPFLKRYLKRDEILFNIKSCDAALTDALGLFGVGFVFLFCGVFGFELFSCWQLSIQIRTLKTIQANELLRQRETQDLLDSLSHLPGLPPPPLPLPLPPGSLSPADQHSVQKSLRALKDAQNAQDRAHDYADLRQLMHTALATNDDAAMIEVLQIARSEMPEAIKTMQRALEHVVDDGRLEIDESGLTVASPSSQGHLEGGGSQLSPTDSGSGSSGDTLDREFMETGIDALRRLSTGTDLRLPSWTITRYEVDLEAKIGFGFFSEVYRGSWRQHTVAIKVLAETTPRKIFVHEVEIWKKLYHPNVIELLGASSATGDPPWFLVRTCYP
jgi:abelson tyrosine-protein kinase 1